MFTKKKTNVRPLLCALPEKEVYVQETSFVKENRWYMSGFLMNLNFKVKVAS
jgi:hypothetical protein